MNHNTLGLLPPRSRRLVLIPVLGLLLFSAGASTIQAQHSVARQWNELHLTSIRKDLARPVVGARNLDHVSLAMWDAWATYDDNGRTILFPENHASLDPNVGMARNEALSFAAYRVLRDRYATSPGGPIVLPQYDQLMADLGYDKNDTSVLGNGPAAIGNPIAAAVIAFGQSDGSNQQANYANQYDQPKNPPLIPGSPATCSWSSPTCGNRWRSTSSSIRAESRSRAATPSFWARSGAT